MIKKLSLPKLLFFVFAPAIGYLISFIILSNLLIDTIPPYLSCLLGIILVMVPFQLGCILITSKKEYGHYSLKSALVFTKKIPKARFITSIVFSIVWASVVFSLLQNIEHGFMFRTVFKFVPDYYKLGDFPNQINSYPVHILKITAVAALLLNGIVAPVIEELYFRGLLLPRISQYGKLAPLIITILFSFYHLFSPWENITRIIAMFPYNYLVWKNQNIFIGIITHCIINSIGGIMMIVMIFSM